MAFDGNGTFLRIMDWTDDAAAGIKIRADRHDAEMDDYAGGLSNTITKDGQTSPTANIPMNGHKIINLGAPTNLTDAATKKYVDEMNDFDSGINVTGDIEFYDGAILRGRIDAVIGGGTQPQMDFWIYDEAGVEKNQMKLTTAGLEFEVGDLIWRKSDNAIRNAVRGLHDNTVALMRFEAKVPDGSTDASVMELSPNYLAAWNGQAQVRMGKVNGTLRGMINCEVTSNSGKVELRAVDNDGASAGSIFVSSAGLQATEFFVASGTQPRARFGWDATLGVYAQSRDGTGALVNYLLVTSFGIHIQGPNGKSQNVYGRNHSADVTRWVVGGNSDAGEPGLGFLICYDNGGVRKQRMEMDAAGLRLLDGAGVAGDILTTGNFPSKSSVRDNTDFIVGTTLTFLCPVGSVMNRNQPVVMRLHPSSTDFTGYQAGGTGALLAGTWYSCGLVVGSVPIVGMARRVS